MKIPETVEAKKDIFIYKTIYNPIDIILSSSRYSVSVRAFNSAGAGPATAPVNTLTQESGKSYIIIPK